MRIGALIIGILLFSFPKELHSQSKQKIYHKNWVDFNKNGKKDVYEDPTRPVDLRIEDLLSQMTLEEKSCQMATLYGFGRVLKDELPTPDWKNQIWKDGIGNIDEQLNNLAYHPSAVTDKAWPPSNHIKALNTIQEFFVEDTRLGIPVDFTNEGIRGLCHEKATSFPSQLGVGATWNKNLVGKIGHITGKEARLLGYTNVYSPILDIARDPRWGRVVECYGEDPYLVGELGYQMVKGIQQEKVVSTPKHFAIYSAPKGGRDGDARTDAHITERELFSLYLHPFKRAIKDAGAMGVMSSYNDYNGVPVSSSKYFLNDILREDWGFKGYVVSDSRAVEFIADKHHVAKDRKDAVRQAVLAGLNVRTDFTMPEDFILPVRELVKEGGLDMATIDDRVRDILRVKFWQGLFDAPYGKQMKEADKTVGKSEYQEVAYQASLESIVLLKNEENILPLDFSKYKSVLVTGPNAKAINHSVSRYGPSHIDVVSVFDGIKEKFPKDVEIKYTKGCDFFDENWPDSELMNTPPTEAEQSEIDKAVAMAKTVGLAIVVLGDDEETVGESRSRTSLDLPGNQQKLVEEIYKTGTPVIVVLINGRPMTINWVDKYVPGIVEGWFQGKFGGSAIADVLVGSYNPGGKLPVSFPKTVGQLPMNFPSKPGAQADQPAKGPNGSGKTRVGGFLYPFGYGLSYTTFEYTNLKIRSNIKNGLGDVVVSVDITNSGKRKGDEIVQLYFSDETSSVTVYEKQLRGFERISLEAGKTKTVNFTLSPEDLSLYNRQMEFVLEPGSFTIMIGSSAEDIHVSGNLKI
ncbi:glycoside hydrolase family 3 N-terminal domain-containing protein [Zobellia galactanivorans]|uniref:glycoside hydrolase family 3 N-terminal domain-containing protein n=1 Tax=Zobellia galactanivorans (strain DSM 12802 / CCUG 47099 / CIP 106680 / NCIMB 13871 / Dsij) TaxID=63186 RepID=UPI0026E32660|nr:glycoside hydrolase family 3 N-terminal domain-containing protein [Zobellia galactanivorans]MDO6809828.1 glycoside hydrolase family 3 N-terminal domain-containing protein [Zobellia galactanivorans]